MARTPCFHHADSKDMNMQNTPPFVLTEAVHTTAPAPENTPITYGTSPIIPDSGMFGVPINVVVNSKEYLASKSRTEQEVRNRLQQLAQSIEHDLAATRLQVPTHPLPPAQAIIRELGVRQTLIARKTAELHQKTALAHQFFGESPINKNFNDYYKKARGNHREVDPTGIAMKAWTSSYKAAHEAKLLSQSIQMLNQQQVDVHKWLAAVQGNDQAQAAAAESARQAAERARVAAEQQRQKNLAEAARRQVEQNEINAREAARLAALQEARQLAVQQAQRAAETARINAEAEAQEKIKVAALRTALTKAEEDMQAAAEQFEQEQQLLQTEMEQKIEHIQIRLETERQSLETRWKVIHTATAMAKRQAQLATKKIHQQKEMLEQKDSEQHERSDSPRQGELHKVYPASGHAAASSPVFSFASNAIRLAPATELAILTTLRSAVLTVTTAATTMLGPVLVGFAALLMPSRLGNGERFSMSVPLAELALENVERLREIADRQGALDLPVGLGIRHVDTGAEVFVVSADDFDARSSVPVLHGTYDLFNDVYETVLPDSPTDFLTWTPALSPASSTTELPVTDTETPDYSGAPIFPVEGRLDLHPVLVEGWDRFIIVFPDDSGIPPLYVVFSSPYEGASVRGKYSGRYYNPEQAGGPTLRLDWRTTFITQAGIDGVKLHIARLDQSDANDIMIRRLEKIMSGYMEPSDTDLRYYSHEIRELERFRALGLKDGFKPDKESSLWNNAHTATLEDFELTNDESLLYTKDAIAAADRQDEDFFNNLLKGGK
ncbi:colicin transporter [Pseudomonas syringae]|nr:colicin transporter [Pseudomonas syringae]MCF5069449.1 colicin transporter [Pseudomonas syringae]